MAINNISNPAQAASLYANSAKSLQNSGGMEGDDGILFGDILKNAAVSAIDTLKAGEKASAQAVTGEADMNDIVRAIDAADMTLQTVVAVRDRLVTSIQELLRLPI
ncbi:MAG: flagellar hook-basal body complex protein FliE [Alphaproteobacteria bacterium]|nr:flagellar hook-basal body complex protein FliE [Alphaproteobacteria bacterium]